MSDPFDAINRAAKAIKAAELAEHHAALWDQIEPLLKPKSSETPKMANIGKQAKEVAATLFTTKTGLTALSGMAAAGAAFAEGAMNQGSLIQTIITCLIGVFLRSGMVKG